MCMPTLRGSIRDASLGARLTDGPLMDVLGDQDFAEAPFWFHVQYIR